MGRGTPSRATYGVSQPVQQMVTMSDGVQLAVDVYRPTLSSGANAPGRFPVILSQTPYGKRSVVTTQSMGQGMGGDGYYPYLVERGYIDVVADVRGSGSSGGDFSLFGPRERQDGVELADWAARLPGSTGRSRARRLVVRRAEPAVHRRAVRPALPGQGDRARDGR